MWVCDGMTTNFCVTPTHRLYSCRQYNYKVKKNDEFELGTIDTFGVEFPIKKDAFWEGKEVEYFELPSVRLNGNSRKSASYKESVSVRMEDWLEFLGLYLSEGFSTEGHYQILIAQSRNSKYFDKIEEILKNLPFEFKYDDSCRRFYCMNKQLYQEVKRLGKAGSKYVPKYVKSLSSRLLEHLMQGLMLGDGTIASDCANVSNDKYDTTSERLINDVQEIALKIGKYGNVKSYEGRSFESPTNGRTYKSNKTFRINFSKRNGYTTVNRKRNVEEIDYEGNIYCVSVSNGVIYTRRKGMPMWGGNSLRYVLMTNPRWQLPRRHQKVPTYKPIYSSTGY